ncbi:hypothetical protein NC651_018202 [Populus alba x Populus x berolinensis]|nr:hypothetical protein NC651_018202 [Populus alba x Populus x berolinensis]
MWLSGYRFYCIAGPLTLSADPYPTPQYKTRSSCFSNNYKDSVEKKVCSIYFSISPLMKPVDILDTIT